MTHLEERVVITDWGTKPFSPNLLVQDTTQPFIKCSPFDTIIPQINQKSILFEKNIYQTISISKGKN